METETPRARKKSKGYLRKGHGMKCKECRNFSCYIEGQGTGLCLNVESSHFGEIVNAESLCMECRRSDFKKEEPKRRNPGILASFIPEDGTYEWAQYVEQNYSTEHFKPVDLFRAGMIVERHRWEKESVKLISK